MVKVCRRVTRRLPHNNGGGKGQQWEDLSGGAGGSAQTDCAEIDAARLVPGEELRPQAYERVIFVADRIETVGGEGEHEPAVAAAKVNLLESRPLSWPQSVARPNKTNFTTCVLHRHACQVHALHSPIREAWPPIVHSSSAWRATALRGDRLNILAAKRVLPRQALKRIEELLGLAGTYWPGSLPAQILRRDCRRSPPYSTTCNVVDQQ